VEVLLVVLVALALALVGERERWAAEISKSDRTRPRTTRMEVRFISLKYDEWAMPPGFTTHSRPRERSPEAVNECWVAYFSLPLEHHALLGTPRQGLGMVAKLVGRGARVTVAECG